MKIKIMLSLALLFFLMPAGQALSEENIESAVKFFNAGEYNEAIDILEEITEKEPSNAKAWFLLGDSYLKLGKTKKAIESYKNTIRIDAENEGAFLGLGHCYSAMREHSDAIEAYKILKTLDKRLADKLYHTILGD